MKSQIVLANISVFTSVLNLENLSVASQSKSLYKFAKMPLICLFLCKNAHSKLWNLCELYTSRHSEGKFTLHNDEEKSQIE